MKHSVWLILIVCCSCKQNKEELINSSEKEILITVLRDYDERPESEAVTFILDWKKLEEYFPQINTQGIRITDQHFGRITPAVVVDTNEDDEPDVVAINYQFTSSEPVYTFKIEPDTIAPYVFGESQLQHDNRLKVNFLKSYSADQDTVKFWSSYIFESSMRTYPNSVDLTIISPDTWTYEYGLFLSTGVNLYHKTKKKIYFDYIKNWVDHFLTEEGKIREDKYDATKFRLDDILPGRLCIFLYEETREEKYKVAVEQLVDHLKEQPKTSDGGYWHKKIYPYQMWLDGIYMGDVFSMQYADVFNKPHWFDEAADQIKLIAKHNRDPLTGLFYHGWDESKNKVWANPETGVSPAFWGRAIGWYMMALVDCLDYLPKDHPDRDTIISIFTSLSKSILSYQDSKSKLWYQVIDKGNNEGNWIETSCSAMFAYAFAKGVNQNILDPSYKKVASEVVEAIMKNYTYYDLSGIFYLDQTVKVGTLNFKSSKGDYDYYITSERRINDYKGISPLIFAHLELGQ